jgi:DNA-binding transcriptional MerR regulator
MPTSDEELISIGRLAADSGVSSRTIRYYEELGILPEPPRTAGGTRKYPRHYRVYVEGALALKEVGFSLDEIKLLGRMALDRPMDERQRAEAAEMLAGRTRSLERKIAVLSRLRDVLNAQATSGQPLRLTDLLDDRADRAGTATGTASA